VMVGALRDRELVLTGEVATSRPAGANWEADLRIGEAMITCRLPDNKGYRPFRSSQPVKA
jgi:hypothetical protein